MAFSEYLAGKEMSVYLMKINNIRSIVTLVFLMASSTPMADVVADLNSEFARLEKSGSTTSQEWFQLAQKARESAELGLATQALNRAEAAGLSSIQFGVEGARLHLAGDNKDAAVAALRGVFEQGFTSVGFLGSDPVISTLDGYASYDALIEEMSVQAYPCVHKEGFADFDFWIGEWEVHVAGGQKAGENSITRQERGCVLVERWQNTAGGTGMSINYLDLAANEWVQIWNAEGGSQINVRGGLTDEGMAMEGTIHYVANGTTAPFRALWSPLADGRVRQYFEQSNDGGETWVPWFEGFYTRKSD